MALLDDLQKLGYGAPAANAITGYFSALKNRMIEEQSQKVLDDTIKNIQFDSQGNIISGNKTNLSLADPASIVRQKSIAEAFLGKISPNNQYIGLVDNIYNNLLTGLSTQKALEQSTALSSELNARTSLQGAQADWLKLISGEESKPSGSQFANTPEESLYHFSERMKTDRPLQDVIERLQMLSSKKSQSGEEISDKDILGAYNNYVKSIPIGATQMSPEQFATSAKQLISSFRNPQATQEKIDPKIEEMKKLQLQTQGNQQAVNQQQKNNQGININDQIQSIKDTLENRVIENTIPKIINTESSGDTLAKSKTSSAAGLGQFTDTTWLELARKYYPSLKTEPDNYVLGLRYDDKISRDLVKKYTIENANRLKVNGIDITPENLYLSHLLGSNGAKILINMANEYPDMKLEDIPIVRQFIPSNKFMSNMTAQDLINYAIKKMK